VKILGDLKSKNARLFCPKNRLAEVSQLLNSLIPLFIQGGYPGMTTEPGRMPEQHAQHQQWTPGRLMNWAQSIGPEVLKWVKAQLQRKEHPEQAYRVCLGLLSLNRSGWVQNRVTVFVEFLSIKNQKSVETCNSVRDTR
jgi:hypothetical protein